MSGISASVAILVMSLFFLDSIDEMLESFFFRSQHQDITVQFTEIRDDATRYELDSLPGVIQTEMYRVVGMRLRHGHLTRRVAVNGLDQGAELQELVDTEGRPVDLPPQGITLTAKLADLLAVEEGGTITVEVLEGRRAVRRPDGQPGDPGIYRHPGLYGPKGDEPADGRSAGRRRCHAAGRRTGPADPVPATEGHT